MAGGMSFPSMLAAAAAMGLAMSASYGSVVTLREGLDGYSGSTTRTVPGGGAGKGTDDPGRLHVRGERNRLFLRFEIPRKLAAGELARARLRLFLPGARKPNMFTELFCREVIGPGDPPPVDGDTDYMNGRPAGALDSVELFAPPHKYWNAFPYLPLGVPEGGTWIDFNVTPLVGKWLGDPETNRGVLIVPTGCPDRRFPSTWEIDIPSSTYEGDAALRPELVMELAPLKGPYLVGMTHGLARICDRSTRYEYRGGYATSHRMSMAANEVEGFQVVVYPMLRDLENVRFDRTDLTSDAGDTIPAADIECLVQDSYRLRANWKTRDVFFRGKLYETVDPLVPAGPELPARLATCRRHVHAPFFFRVRTRPDTAAGTYRASITVRADDAPPSRLDLEVRVWPYAIPEKWNFHTMGQLVEDKIRRFHGREFDSDLFRKYYDFLLDHRFAPTEQYIPILSPRKDMERCLARGMNTLYLSGNFRGSDREVEELRGRHGTVTRLGALDHAIVYIGDETDKWDEMSRRADLVHAHLPGAKVMIGGSFPREELTGHIDVYDPQIGGKSKVYSLQEENAHLVGEAQARGEEFYWYVAAGPAYPYPNVQVEYPLIASRVLFWMTWKYGVTGFEYYCYNIWERNYSADAAKRYPHSEWKADGWSKGWPSNGDGMLFYPGPISSLRFEAIRDGIEDWESLMVLRDCVEAVRNRKDAAEHRGIVAEAEKLLAIDERIVAGFKRYTMDPDTLLAEREAVGDLIARFVEVISRRPKWDPGAYTLARAGEVRRAREISRRRKMLRERHLAACKALEVDELSGEAWNELWPRRVLFRQDFEGEGEGEGEGDWDGSVVTEGLAPGSRRALAGGGKNRHFAQFARVGLRDDCARAASTTRVRFRYHVSKPVPIRVMLFDLTQGDNYAAAVERPEVGEWTEVTMDVTRDFRRKDGSTARMAAGDAIDDVFFGAGTRGSKGVRLVVDDVVLLGLD